MDPTDAENDGLVAEKEAPTDKIRITIRLDEDIVLWFKAKVEHPGRGMYQRLINRALRDYIKAQDENLEETLRRVIREELPQFFY